MARARDDRGLGADGLSLHISSKLVVIRVKRASDTCHWTTIGCTRCTLGLSHL